MRILVTGSEGSLAQCITPFLVNSGHQVIGVDNHGRYGHVDRQRDYDFLTGDLCDTAFVQNLFSGGGYDAVFHCAALVYGVVGFHEKPADIIADNNLPTINLLKYGHESIGKFVYISSSMVYERCTAPHTELDTRDSPVMHTSYGLSKYIGERVVQSFQEQYGVKYVIWRPFNIITPFEPPEEVGFSHVFSDLIDKILVQKQQPLEILGDGEQVRCFTNIGDIGEAIVRFSLDPRAENEIFNIGNLEPVSVRQLAQLIVQMGKQLEVLPVDYELEFDPQPIYDDDVRRRVPDVNKIQRVFGWDAKTKVRKSLEMCIKHRIATGVFTRQDEARTAFRTLPR